MQSVFFKPFTGRCRKPTSAGLEVNTAITVDRQKYRESTAEVVMIQSELRPGRGRSESFITDNWAQKSLNKPFLLHFAGTFYIVASALYSLKWD